MKRRAFVKAGVGGLTAAATVGTLRAIAQGDAAGTAPTEDRSKPRISGSFFDLAHVNLFDAAYWTDACRFWCEQNWRALIRDMHGIGIDTAICGSTAFWGRPVFAGYEKSVGIPLKFGCADPLGVCMDEAGRLGMKVFLGVGLRGRCSQVRDYDRMEPPWPEVWFRWNTALAEALLERYSHSKCFAGLYIPYEIDFEEHQVELYEKWIRGYLRPVIGQVKLLASPGNIGVELPGRQLDKLPGYVERARIDILAPQDYGGRSWNTNDAMNLVRRNAQALEQVRKPLKEIGVTLWANCEVFRLAGSPDGRAMCVPGPIERIEQQMAIQAPMVEKLICYQYQGIMNRRTELVNIGHPSTDKLYGDYLGYLRQIRALD